MKENFVEKGEDAGNQQFLHFEKCFLHSHRQFTFAELLSALALNVSAAKEFLFS